MSANSAETKKSKKAKIAGFFKSRVFWCIVCGLLSILAVVVMVHIDYYNDVRVWLYGSKPMTDAKGATLLRLNPEGTAIMGYLYAGDNNVFSSLLSRLGLGRYDIMWNSWLVFLMIIGIVWFVLVAMMLSGKFEEKHMRRLSKRFHNEKTRRQVYKLLYFCHCMVVAIAVVMILFACGLFDNPHSGDILANVFITFAISAACIAAIIFAIVGVGLLLTFIFYFVGVTVRQMSKGTVDKLDEPVLADGYDENGNAMEMGDLGSMDNPVVTNSMVEGSVSNVVSEEESDNIIKASNLFPALTIIDDEENLAGAEQPREPFDITPSDFVVRFQAYLCVHHKLYYELPLLRAFLAGLSAGRIIILEGLSGTGKSMLPRMFGEFVGSKTFFAPVQATWRDRTDVVGYYSDFTKEFKETEFLKRLYRMNYHQNDFNLMVLDEMNISRIEYYFADFLSILEYPASDWLVKLMQIKAGQDTPIKLENGNVRIPRNTWFIGTANTDDSTFTITDKVYDRAIIIDFKEKNSPITPKGSSDPLTGYGVEQFYDMAKQAYANPALALNTEENAKFMKICDLAYELFDIRFGNRILNQINNFIPVYALLGGTKDEAVDFMFARKVIRKLEGKFDDYIKDGLVKMQKNINAIYGKEAFVETNRYITKLLKKFY